MLNQKTEKKSKSREAGLAGILTNTSKIYKYEYK